MTIEEILDTVKESLGHIEIIGCTDVNIDYEHSYINEEDSTLFEICVTGHKLNNFEEDFQNFAIVIKSLTEQCKRWSGVEDFTVKSIMGTLPEEIYVGYIEAKFNFKLTKGAKVSRGKDEQESKYSQYTWEKKDFYQKD